MYLSFTCAVGRDRYRDRSQIKNLFFNLLLEVELVSWDNILNISKDYIRWWYCHLMKEIDYTKKLKIGGIIS